jgi:membrane-associated phospholipid phosphatase
LKGLVKSNLITFSLLFLYIVAGFILLLVFPKGDFELLVNRGNHPLLDTFFYYITYFGDGILLLSIILLIGLRKVYYGFLALISFLISTAIVQGLKRSIFSEYPRPSKFFDSLIDIHVVKGLELHSFHSFPSGHASGVFSVFLMLALLAKNKFLSVFFVAIAVLTAFSRVYLFQHFLIDIYVGGLMGGFTAILVYWYVENKTSLKHKTFFKKSIFEFYSPK